MVKNIIYIENRYFIALWITDPAKVIVAGTQTVTTVEGLTPATSYHIRVIAENSMGFSEPSDEAQAFTQEEGIMLIKVILKVIFLTTLSVDISGQDNNFVSTQILNRIIIVILNHVQDFLLTKSIYLCII